MPPIDDDRIAALIDAYNQGIGIAEGEMPDLPLKLTEAKQSRIWAVFKQLDHKLRNKEIGRNECLREAYAACGELPYKSAITLVVYYGRSLGWLPAYRNTYGQVKCRVCGCTDRTPCNPPCNRVEEGLCSTCLEAARALLYWRQRAFKPGPNALWMELNRLYRRDLALAQESASAPKISVILPPAPPLEAMMDQLEYLANHASGRVCPDNCWACVRLREAEDLLLKPFMQTA